jgi:hypothetical protein
MFGAVDAYEEFRNEGYKSSVIDFYILVKYSVILEVALFYRRIRAIRTTDHGLAATIKFGKGPTGTGSRIDANMYQQSTTSNMIHKSTIP